MSLGTETGLKNVFTDFYQFCGNQMMKYHDKL